MGRFVGTARRGSTVSKTIVRQSMPATIARRTNALPVCIAGHGTSEDVAGVLKDLAEMGRVSAASGTEAYLGNAAFTLQCAQLGVLYGDLAMESLGMAMSDYAWTRRKLTGDASRVGLGLLAVMGDGDLDNLKLPRHLFLELRRAREGAMPDFFKDRAYFYLNTLLEKAR